MRTARLYVDVEFDEEITDADSVASALSVLLETALSTKGVLGEHGNPHVSGFCRETAPPADDHAAVVERLTDKADSAGLQPEDLDEAVHELASIRDGLGQYWAGESRRWSDKPADAVLFHAELDAMEARNRHCLGGDVADTFAVTVLVTVHSRRWSRKTLSAYLERHRKLFLGGPAGREGLLLEIIPDTLRKVEGCGGD
jgi:hypothetical protein